MHANSGKETPASLRCENGRVLLEGALTMDTVPALLHEARTACTRSEVQVVDFAGVTALDSAAIALALELRRARGDTLRLENVPPAAMNLARLYSVADQLGIQA